MNPRQRAFFRQASSDWGVFCHFHPSRHWIWTSARSFCMGRSALPKCHALHYLQMCTEKLAKAYYRVTPPRMSHNAFRRFMTDLPATSAPVAPLGFVNHAGLTAWLGSVATIVGAIEDLASPIAESKNLPNPEYPWPRNAETHAPADYSFGRNQFSAYQQPITQPMVASIEGWPSGPPEARHSEAAAMS